MSKKVVVIGSGFAGISAAAYLAKAGFEVHVLEKNEGPGGRASVYSADGFTFDMGPSWYWMPDVFERWFGDFGHKPADFYHLERMDPSYRVWWGKQDFTDVPAQRKELFELFESFEPGCSANLDRFLKEAAHKYQAGIHDLVYRPSRSVTEFLDLKLLTGLFKLDLFKSYRKHVDSLFQNTRVKQILEFPVYFLGGIPQNTPALYSLMSYADLALGTWYPMGGMHEIIKGMVRVAEEQGVTFHYHQEVQQVAVSGRKVTGLHTTDGQHHPADAVVAGADYHHVEQQILQPQYRRYTPDYWDKRVMAPSSLIFYIGLNKRVKNLLHHNLFFDQPFSEFAREIYDEPQWPSEPLFYVNVTSRTDPSTAPEGCENLYILIPVAPALQDTEEAREAQFQKVMARIETLVGEPIRDHVIYKRSFAHRDFESRYHAFKGNAYGLANTLMQTAVFKPSLKNPKLDNLFYAGQLTVPGPGVPPSLISGKVVAGEALKDLRWG
ncbi:MAG: phytoene desaturase [Bacteroidetes bacterium]|nr:phytoene desaturase [Bacteroidota bacterium]